MSDRPDLRELVGDDCSPEELQRMRLAHELLLAADPPPSRARQADMRRDGARLAPARRRLGRHRYRAGVLMAAAAVLVLGIGIGYAIRGGNGFSGQTLTMRGIADAKDARATIRVGNPDRDGNWPLLLSVHGLKTLPSGAWYTLYLTKNGKLIASCGTFRTSPAGLTLRLNAPYDLGKFSGWVITVHLSHPSQRDHVVLTTLS